MYRHTKVNTILEIISREEKENGEIIRQINIEYKPTRTNKGKKPVM